MEGGRRLAIPSAALRAILSLVNSKCLSKNKFCCARAGWYIQREQTGKLLFNEP